jgi:hypothetical protein
MSVVREPVLKPVAILDLRPTQITVGMTEVEEKRQRLRKRPPKKVGTFLGAHMIPVVLGPRGRNYIVDHHHLSLALHLEGMRDVLVTVIADMSWLERDQFWTVLDHHAWVHPYDTEGRRRGYSRIPKTVEGLVDDPFRSLAGALRRAGGFAKETTPFSEFLWADFLRRRFSRRRVERRFGRTLKEAMAVGRSEDARYLPGWCGPTEV